MPRLFGRFITAPRLAAVVLSAVITGQVAAQIPEKFENLKVLPKNIPRDSLVQVMRGFAIGLGVRCTYCHVAEPKPADAPANAPEKLIFKSDDKVQKRKARVMVRMVDRINHSLLTAVPERHDPPVVVRCATCHRGSPLPQTLDMALTEIIDRAGVDSAVIRYKTLRDDMVSGRYDFSELSLNELARELNGSGKTDAALAMLQLNQQYYPASGDIDYMMAELYLKRGDKDQAVAHYQADLAKRPQDERAKKKLQGLGVASS